MKKAAPKAKAKAKAKAKTPLRNPLESRLRKDIVESIHRAIDDGLYCVTVFRMPTIMEVSCEYHPQKWPDAQIPSMREAFLKNTQKRLDTLAKTRKPV